MDRAGVMRGRLFFITLGVFLLLCAPSSTWAQVLGLKMVGVEVEGRYWFTDLSGTIRADTPLGGAGATIDLENDLGMGDENFPEVRVALTLMANRLRFGFIPIDYDGSRLFTQTITFGGVPFGTVSEQVNSSLEMDYFRLGYEFLPFRRTLGLVGLRLGLILDLKYFDGTASLVSSLQSKVVDFRLPVPTIGAGVRYTPIRVLSLSAEVTGLPRVEIANRGGSLVDAEVFATFSPIGFFGVSVGYRVLDIDLEDKVENAFADLTMKGFFFMARLEF